MRVGEIISRIGDAVKIRIFINSVVLSLIVDILMVLFTFLFMFSLHWRLTLYLLLFILIYAIVYWLTNRFNKKTERKLMEKAADLESQLVESLNSIKTIKHFGLESFTNTKTEVRFIQLLKTTYRSALNEVFSTSSAQILSQLFSIVLLWMGSFYVMRQEITIGELLSFYAVVNYFTGPVGRLIGANVQIQNALIASDRLFEIMDLEDATEEQTVPLSNIQLGDIVFKGVAFRYGTRKEVFQDFSACIQQGKVTAIVGESGSGKSTLVALLQKLYPVTGGNIYIGEQNLKYLTEESLKQYISVVPQHIDLFAGNVIDNIAVGEFVPNMERIVDICNSIGILNFIEQLPSGFHTYLGEHGAALSGGEKQRIAIARALYQQPEILILDEATSSLDSQSEQYIKKTVQALKKKKKTILLIAHRLSTVIDADQILVLKKGKVVASGTHKTLLREQGLYRTLWEQQRPS